jgi:chromosome segregation ATPase
LEVDAVCHCTPAPDTALAALVLVLNKLESLEASVATAAEQITALSAKVDDIAADFTALVTALNAERENLTEAGQAALDAANAKLEALDVAVGDADGSDTPPAP